MAATIISTALNAGGKILRKSQSSTEVDGLVTLTESYTIRSQDIENIEPARNTSYNAFTGTTKFPRMSVETTEVAPMDGGLATLVVNYVGLDSASGLPPAYVTAAGQPGVGVFGADAAIVVKYITDQSFFDLLKGGNIALKLGNSSLVLPTKRLMPTSINGTILPPNPRSRIYKRSPNEFTVGVQSTPGETLSGTSAGSGFSQWGTISGFTPRFEWLYAGYVQSALSFARRGQFNQVEEQFTEYIRASEAYITEDGLLNIPILDDGRFTNAEFKF